MSEQLTADQFLAKVSGNVADIADLPEFVNPVPGTYVVGIESASVEGLDDNKPYLDIRMRMISTVEQTGEQAEYPEGSPMGFRFYGEFGLQKFKKLFGSLLEVTNASSIAGLLDSMAGMEVGIVTGQRKDKDDPNKVYTDLKLVTVM